MNVLVAPSILSADFANLERDIKIIETAGADWVHIDVMDGHFVPNITIGAPVVAALNKITKLPLDVHLMIDEPQKYAPDFVKAGADIITFHYETTFDKTGEVIDFIRSLNVKVGLSIKPKTPPEAIKEYLSSVDMVLIMSVEPGFGGQEFMQNCADKITYIKENAPKDLIVQVDGGINDKTAKICTNLGANCLVAGNYIYKSANIRQAIKSLQ